MARLLSDEDIRAIAIQLIEYSGMSTEEHREHHEALGLFIEREKRRQDHWDKVNQQVSGWGIVSIISAVGFGAYNLAINFISHIKN